MKTLISVLLCLMMWSGAATALAQTTIPTRCQESSFTIKAYESGVVQGKNLVDRVFASINNDCAELERLTDIIITNVKNYTIAGISTYNICRHTGMVDGVYQGLDVVWITCDGLCCEEGAAIGKLAAEMYCRLSILLGGLFAPDDFLRRPVFECGFEFEMCCDGEFTGTSLTYLDLDANGKVRAECRPYTKDPFFYIWNGTRELQCAYTPQDP